MQTVVERFLRYVKIDTHSDQHIDTHPTTTNQLELSKLLAGELKELGLEEIEIDAYGNVTATLPSNCEVDVPTMGLLAHVDTVMEISSANVNPQFVENYNGGDIPLNKPEKVLLSPVQFPELKKYIGQTLITTDGTTLLGADDKAGLAEIMTALEHIQHHPEIRHSRLRIAFTTDEETGRGIDVFDVTRFKADYAFTVDGGELGELEYENFNAAKAHVSFHGLSVHPGDAKDKMVNAIQVAIEFNELLPVNQRPEYTTGYEGYFHLFEMAGKVEETKLTYYIRDHSKEIFENRKELLQKAVEWVNHKYGSGTVTLNLKDEYANMREKIEPVFWLIERARKAMEMAKVTPITKPIRGGTDGAKLSWRGLPTPNLFTGGMNFHGKYECIPVPSMEKAVEVLVNLIGLSSQNPPVKKE